MPDHLPECWAKHEDDPPAWCICDELRGCEQRVRGEEQQRIEAALTSVGQHDVGWELAIRDNALRDAREALFGAKAIDVYYGRGLDEPPQFIWLNNALVAIDALREKQ